MVCQEQNTRQSETLARKTQCFGRLSVQEREHCSDRMVTESASDKPDISHLGYSSSGSICTRLNRKLQLFVSPVPDPEAYATDALNLSWMGMWAYAFPPYPLILSCLRKIQNEECIVCLIAPLWEGQAWYPLLMVIAPLLRLPAKKDLLCQPVSRMLQPIPQVFRLHAWLLCNNKCKRQALLSQLPDESIQRRDLPPTICMITGGNLG